MRISAQVTTQLMCGRGILDTFDNPPCEVSQKCMGPLAGVPEGSKLRVPQKCRPTMTRVFFQEMSGGSCYWEVSQT